MANHCQFVDQQCILHLGFVSLTSELVVNITVNDPNRHSKIVVRVVTDVSHRATFYTDDTSSEGKIQILQDSRQKVDAVEQAGTSRYCNACYVMSLS